jgi:outer membrane protein
MARLSVKPTNCRFIRDSYLRGDFSMIRSSHALSGFMGFLSLVLMGPALAQVATAPPPATAAPVETPAATGTLGLSEAMAAAYETNPQLAEARASLEALDQNVAQANAGWRPSINATVQQGYDHGVIAGLPNGLNESPTVGAVTVTQPLFRGGRTDAEISRAVSQVHAGRAQLASTEQAVLLGAVTAYLDVLRDLQIMNYSRANVRALEDQLRDVQTELSAGAVTRTDVYQVQGRLAHARGDEANAGDRLAASQAAFENVIGRPALNLSSDITFPHLPMTKEAALEVALKQNPDLDQARANERAASYAIDDAVGALLPEVSVSGQYQYLLGAPNSSIFVLPNRQQVTSVMGQVNVPIYQGGAEEASVRKAKDLHEQASMALISAERGVRQNLDSAWEAFKAGDLAITAFSAQVAADQNAVSGVVQEQEAGERLVIDILNAQEELFLTQVQLADARHDRMVAAYRLLAITGQLTARDQALNVNLYDPQKHYDENAGAWFGFDK